MADFDAETLAEQACLLGLITREQSREAIADADDLSLAALIRSFLRKGLLTSWQLERLQKDDPSGFFYGGYKVLFHLAEGTFARVYRGQKVDSGQPVAIKVLRQRFVSDPVSVERFNKEAEAGMRLRHPNIVQILDFGEQDRRHYMIMEYVEGSNLRDFLKLRGRLDSKTALPLMIGLAKGLQYSIASGVTHRDIKGTNILISNSGAAKLVDFGLATIEGDEKRTMQSQRTVDYSALERTCGSQKGDPRSDIYFLGCVFYQMLTGQLPLPEVESKDMMAKMLKRSFGAIKPLSEHNYAPDPQLSAIIEQMMKMDLRSRYQTLDEVVDALDAYKARKEAPVDATAESEEDHFADIFERRPADDEQPGTGPTAVKAVASKKVLCVEAQNEIQEAFRKTLSKMGYRVFLIGNAEVAAERYREQTPDVVIFDVDGLGPDAVDAFIDMHDKAHEDGLTLSALVLLGPKQKTLHEKLPTDDRLIVLNKPIKMKDVQDAITQLAPIT